MSRAVVIDSSVAVKWCFNEAGTEQAVKLFESFRHGEIHLLAPDLFSTEVANIIWKKHVLRGEIDVQQGQTALELILAASPELVAGRSLAKQAWQLAVSFKHPVYDCMYVALALSARCDFVTADQRLVHALRPALTCVVSLADWAI